MEKRLELNDSNDVERLCGGCAAMYGYPLAFTKSRKAVYDAKIIFFGSNGFSLLLFGSL